VINLSAELLQGSGQQGPRGLVRDNVGRICSEVTRMSMMIEDLLRLATYASGFMQVETVDISQTAEDIVAKLRQNEPERQIDIHIQPDMTAKGDTGLLKIALENLLSNAWKYTGKQDKARIDFRKGINQRGMLEFRLADNGAGFDMGQAARLFLPFNRLHDKADFKGTGVGLATVHRILRKHGGNIRAESAPGMGATFIFTLPQL
ncbi:MAG TPA: ATP-binding protein, partial [Candidatus Acidoferrum sp.]|nr:ATP-binding protein [Candidatus Acidoferrum sp.]